MRISDWSSDVCSSDLGFKVARGFLEFVELSFGFGHAVLVLLTGHAFTASFASNRCRSAIVSAVQSADSAMLLDRTYGAAASAALFVSNEPLFQFELGVL